MEISAKNNGVKKRIRRFPEHRIPVYSTEITVKANSMSHLFENSLKYVAQLLKPGFCETVSHSDCIMKLEATGVDRTALLIDFLTKTLKLSRCQHAIFCSMYIEYLSETKLIATLFGSWFKRYDQELRSVIGRQCTVDQNIDLTLSASIVFRN